MVRELPLPRGACAVLLLMAGGCLPLPGLRSVRAAEPTLAQALQQVQVPPEWFAQTPIRYDTAKPWKDARLHIRQLLGELRNREAIRLTYDYLVQRKVQEDTHEYPMYLYLGGEYAWATKVYIERLADKPKGQTFDYKALASLYARYGEFPKAIETLQTALQRLPDPPWEIMNRAQVFDSLGDVYAAAGDADKAKEHYREAVRLFPTSNQPYGRHLLHRHAAKTQAKLDLLARQTLDITQLRDGTYRGESLGYGEPVRATVKLQGGRIVDIQLHHKEKIEQGATRIVPRQIIERQGLQVDAITGATVTVQAIVEATYRALQKAGLK